MFLVKLKNGKELKCVSLERLKLETIGEFLRFLTVEGKQGNIYENQIVNLNEVSEFIEEGENDESQ